MLSEAIGPNGGLLPRLARPLDSNLLPARRPSPHLPWSFRGTRTSFPSPGSKNGYLWGVAGTDPNLALAQERIINVTVFSLICSYLVLTHFHTPYELAISPPPNLLLLSPISILCQFRYHITTRLFALPELIIAQRKQYVALPLPLQPSSR